MKTFFRLLPFLGLLSAVAIGARAAPAAPPAAANEKPEFAIVVVESLRNPSTSNDVFNRIARVFEDTFEKRKWPVKIVSERLAANMKEYPIELRVFFQRLEQETGDDLTFRAWMTLHANGKKHDFGVVLYRYYPRAGEQMDDRLDKAIAGAAELAAKKVQPILFPTSGPSQP